MPIFHCWVCEVCHSISIDITIKLVLYYQLSVELILVRNMFQFVCGFVRFVVILKHVCDVKRETSVKFIHSSSPAWTLIMKQYQREVEQWLQHRKFCRVNWKTGVNVWWSWSVSLFYCSNFEMHQPPIPWEIQRYVIYILWYLFCWLC